MSVHSTDRRHFIAAAGLGILWPGNWFGRNTVRMAGIPFHRIKKGAHGRHYLWIHGNERTAHDVLIEHLKSQQNVRAYLTESTERNVRIDNGVIDPNRMWSRVGAERSLRSLNKNWTDAQVKGALDRLDHAREGMLKRLLPPRGEVIIALHNNGPAYSVNDELDISDAVTLNDKDHPDEFMLCVVEADFQVLSGGPFNVLLQNKKPQEDDGSLSRLCAKRGVRYVNIEAALGNAEAQRRMLDWIERVL